MSIKKFEEILSTIKGIMCDFCKHQYSHAFKHPADSCPFQTSLYCSSCACYGHSTKSCPDPPSTVFTKPCFLEQLIPASLLKEHRITTKTLLPIHAVPAAKQTLELTNDDEVLKAFLFRKGQLSSRSIKPAALRDLVRAYASTAGLELILV